MPNYSNEQDLRRFAALSPEENDASLAYERSPRVKAELEAAIRSETDPAKRRVLEQLYIRDFGGEGGEPQSELSAFLDKKGGGKAAPAAARELTLGEYLGSAPSAPASKAVPKRSVPAAVNDTVIEFANAAAGGVSSAGEFLSPGNRVSRFINENVIRRGEESQSDEVKAEKARLASELNAAQGAGDEISAVGGYVLRNPMQSLAQAGGSFVGPGAAIKGSRLAAQGLGASQRGVTMAGLYGGAGAGGAMAGGDAAGQAYELVRQAGGTEEEAVAAARKASVIPAAVGAAGGVVGAERIFAGAARPAASRVGNAVRTAAVEGLQEGVEEGITNYEGRRAAVPYDATIDPMKGTAAAAAQGAILGAATGGGVAVLGRPGDHIRAQMVPESGPMTRATNAGLEQQAAMADAGITVPPNPDDAAAQEQAAKKQQKEAQAEADDAAQRTPIFSALVADVRSALSEPGAMDAVRARFGEEGATQLLASLNQATNPKVPASVREKHLQAVEEAMFVLKAQRMPAAPQGIEGESRQALEAPQAPLGIELDTTPTGTMRVDSAGNVAPETRADAISTQAAVDEQISLGKGVPRGSQRDVPAVPVEQMPAPTVVTEAAAPAAQAAPAEPEISKMGNSEIPAAPAAPVAVPAQRQGPFDNPEAAESYISQQRRSGGGRIPPALPRRHEDGSYSVVTEGREGFDEAQAQAKERAKAAAGIKPGDVLNKLGDPFKNKGAAVRAQKTAGGNVIEVKGGWVVRPESEAKKALTGEAINDEWTAFSAESGTKGVPRSDMPQIKAEHRGAMVNFLNARGVTHESDIEIQADQLKPTQAEFSPAKVAKAREFTGGDRSILVSADGHVVDGHHQWVAKLDKGESVKSIRLNAPIDELLPLVKEFPSASVSGGASPASVPKGSSLAKQWAEAVRQGDTEEARRVNDLIVAEKKAKEQPAEAPAPEPSPPQDEVPAEPTAAPAPRAPKKPADSSPTEEVAAPPVAEPSAAARIDDAGEKIGGARKDRWKERGLDVSDLDAMSESEGATLATKANVWKPDYEAIAKESEPVTAAMVKVVYDSLAAKPKTDTPQGRRDYVRAMQAVRSVYSSVKSPQEAKDAYQRLREELGVRSRQGAGYTDTGDKDAKRVMFSVYKGRSDPFVFGYNELARAKKLVQDGFPAAVEPWKRRFVVRSDGGPGLTEAGVRIAVDNAQAVGTPLTAEQAKAGFYSVRVKAGGKTVAMLPTLEDAEAAAKALYERTLEKATTTEPARPHLDKLRRSGMPAGIDRDVTPDDFLKQFGFRGVEFGNWAAQDERQRILNMAYDGLSDLAVLLNVPPKALSLNSTLGMAFGARGGGKHAAHYEPGKLVINMTKLAGGGSLAHEFAHALDHYFGELDRPDAYTTKARGASGWYTEEQYRGVPMRRMERVDGKLTSVERMRLENLRPEMAKAFDGVMTALFSDQETKAQMIRGLELQVERTQGFAAKEQEPDTKAMYERMAKSQAANLEEARKEPDDKLYPKGRSKFATEAQKLSGKSSNGYWLRPTEMFARAFESYVFDRLTAMGAQSEYLVHGVEENRFAGGDYKGNPYPAGEERARINKAFDKLVAEIKTREDDAGKVVMFSRSGPAVATLSGNEIAGDVPTVVLRRKAMEFAERELVGKSFTHAESGTVIAVTRAGVKHGVSGANAIEIRVLPALPALLEKATLAETLPDKLGRPDVKSVQRYEGVVKVGDESLAVGVIVREMADGHRYYDHFALKDKSPSGTSEAASGNQKLGDQPALGDGDSVNDGAAFSRGNAMGASRVDRVQGLVDMIAERWAEAPPIHVAPSINDPSVPEAVREEHRAQQSQGASGSVDGVYFDGQVYLFADRLPGDAHVLRVLFHEVLGHAGLRAVFGADIKKPLNRLATLNPGRVAAKAARYGLDMNNADERLLAAEEVLAEMAEKSPSNTWVQSAIAAIRTWLREHVPGFGNMELSDAEIIRDFILPARRYIKEGIGAAPAFADTQPMFSRFSDTLREAATKRGLSDLASDLFTSQKTFNWWHRSVGTQYHKASVSPEFKAVYDRTQDYLHDTTAFATDAAGTAPDLLPQLNTWRDLGRRIALKESDKEAVAKAVFAGTLTDKKVYDADELRSKFGLNDEQIGLYRQFRASVDRSLDILGAADVARLLADELPPAVKAMVSQGDTGRFKGLVLAHLKEQKSDLLQTVEDKFERIEQLKSEGYAPLMRFGRYTVDVVDGSGERVFFGMYESQREANAAARDLTEPGVKVTQGIMSQEAFKQFQGVSPETLELFAEMAGVEKNELFQQYLKLAVANRSALKRLIERKGIAGYSEDPSRVLAAFVTSNARAASGNLHMGEISRAVAAIPKQQGDVLDEAQRLKDYVQNPTKEAQAIRGLLFTQYIGGSIASAMVNMTQPLTMTYPFLAQYGGAVKAASRLVAGIKGAVSGVSDPKLKQAMEIAEKEGIVSPQEIHQLQAEASRSTGNNPWVRKGLFLWGSLFSLAEQFNRRATFIAAYNTAVAEGMGNPFQFAADAVDQTQGVYNRANKPNWARGALGGTLFTFKQYSISYMEFLKRLPPKERALALAVLMLAAGAQGLPGVEDIDDVIDTIAQFLGYDFNSKQQKARFLTSIVGEGGAEFMLHGFSALPGFPLDVSARMSVSNLIPGTGMLLKSKTDKSNEVLEVAGPAGGMARDVLKAIQTGDATVVLPLALRNIWKGLDMYQTGQYRDGAGRKVIDVDAADAAIKAVGFQPAEVAQASRTMSQNMQQVNLAKNIESEIAAQWAHGLADGDAEKVKAARERLADWNAKNESSRIAISMPQLLRRVREIRMTRADRAVKAAPREMRGSVAEALSS